MKIKKFFKKDNLSFQFDRILRILNFFNLNLSLYKLERGSHNFTYRGIVCRKNPIDLALIQELIYNLKPDLIVEIGTNLGGSALFYADLLEMNSYNGIVHTIDIEDHGISKIIQSHRKIQLFTDGYQKYDLKQLINYKRKIIIDDGSHTYNDVLSVLRNFSPYLISGDYFVVEDGALSYFGWSRHYGGGPKRALLEFLGENGSFSVDFSLINKFGKNSSSNSYGYLVKK